MSRCSFCWKISDKVEYMIAGPNGVKICNECIDLCNEVITEEEKKRAEEKNAIEKIYERLDKIEDRLGLVQLLTLNLNYVNWDGEKYKRCEDNKLMVSRKTCG